MSDKGAKLIISVAHSQFQEQLDVAAFKRFGLHFHYLWNICEFNELRIARLFLILHEKYCINSLCITESPILCNL